MDCTTTDTRPTLDPLQDAIFNGMGPALRWLINSVIDERLAALSAGQPAVAVGAPCTQPLLVKFETAVAHMGWTVSAARTKVFAGEIPVVDLSAHLHGAEDRRCVRVARSWLAGAWASMDCGVAPQRTEREDVVLAGWAPTLSPAAVGRALGCGRDLAIRLMEEGGLRHFRQADGRRVVVREVLEAYVHRLIHRAEDEWETTRQPAVRAKTGVR